MDEWKLKAECLLRRAGLANVSRGAIAGVCAVCAVLVLLAAVRFWPAAFETDSFEMQQTQGTLEQSVAPQDTQDTQGTQGTQGVSEQAGTGNAQPSVIKVDVEGCVEKPGVYELEGDARVVDAVNAAGGLTKKAAKGNVNLAEKVEDGKQIYIPSKHEIESGAALSNASAQGAAESALAATGAAGSSASAGQEKVNLNSATEQQLQQLPGVGPVLSASIVEYRDQSGGFASVDDLKNVSGIGDTRFERLKDLVCV